MTAPSDAATTSTIRSSAETFRNTSWCSGRWAIRPAQARRPVIGSSSFRSSTSARRSSATCAVATTAGKPMALRVGVVGAGLWAERAHLPGFVHDARAEVVAICDADLARAEILAEQFGVPNVLADYHDLIGLGLDAVSIV